MWAARLRPQQFRFAQGLQPNLINNIKSHFESLRKVGVSVATKSARSFIIGYLTETFPEVFEVPWKNGRMFECSEAWVRQFFVEVMGWSERRATRAAQKVPQNWIELLQELRLRLAWLIKEYDIPAELFLNFDQTNVVYSHGSSSTWAPTGSKQVAIIGTEEKRAFTVVVGVTSSGQALPFQVIYKGQTAASLPTTEALGYEEAIALGFQFVCSKTDTYWATFDTMAAYLRDIVEPYVAQQRERLGLPPDQKAIILMDVWAVHRSRQFLDHITEHHPNLIPCFVPGGCTGQGQPCDLLPQRIFKHAVKQTAMEDGIADARQQISRGTAPENVKLDTSIKILRNRSPRWLVNGYLAINKQEVAGKVCASSVRIRVMPHIDLDFLGL